VFLDLKQDFPSNSLYLVILGFEEVKISSLNYTQVGDNYDADTLVHN